MEDRHFHIADYIIFGTTLIVSMAIGLYFGFIKKTQFSSADYFFGGKRLGSVPVAFSFIVTFQSSLMVLGFPAETYGYGMKLSFMCLGVKVSFILGTLIVVPIFRPLEITSIYKYFNLRYGSNEVRYIAAIGGIIYFIFYMAIVVLGTCVALNSVLKVPFWATVITYTIVTTIYTSLGGFKAVIWTDVFQLVIMVTGILGTLIKSVLDAGGPSSVHSLAGERFDVADFRLDPTLRYSFWISSFGPITQYLYLFFTQASFQRVKSTPDSKSTYKMFVIVAPVYCFFFALCFFEGVAIFAYYASIGCDPLASGRIDNINEVVPHAVMDLFGTMPGFPGLFIASLSSAVLSTLSSCLTGLGSITFEDIIKVRYPHLSDKKATKWSKAVVFIYGFLAMGVCFLMSFVSGPVTAVFQAFMSSIDGPVCGIFIMSIFFLRSTTKGVMIGAAAGMSVCMVLNLGQTFLSIPSRAYLPLGPTENCTVAGQNSTHNLILETNVSQTPVYVTAVPWTTNQITQNTSSVLSDSDSDITVLQKIFGVSFFLFSLIGFLITVTIGGIASLLTESTPKDKVDMSTLYPLPDKYCSFFPDGFFYSRSCYKERHVKSEENIELMKKSDAPTLLEKAYKSDMVQI